MSAGSWRVSRRTFLRGAGTAVALPWLDAMMPFGLGRRALAQAAAAPQRFLAYYVPCGIHMPAWTPATEGRGYAMPPILQPLDAYRDDVLVISGLANLPARPDGPGDHAAGTGSFLTATHVFKTEGANIQNGVSLDQAIAQRVGGATRFPSVELGAEGGGRYGNCDSGYSCAYSRNISWSGPATPVQKEVNPQAVFDRLFQGADPLESAETRARKRALKKSILDYVQADTARLQAKLGTTDRRKLDEYLEGVRAVERRIEAPDDGPACRTNGRPPQAGDAQQIVRQMSDLMVLAFQCDLTRVATFMLANAGTGRAYTFLGIQEGHHELSHHMDNPENFRKLQIIDTWEVSELAYLLAGLKSVREGPDGATLLDHTLIYWSSEIEDGNAHRHTNLPVLLAGHAGGAGGGGAASLTPGRHWVARDVPLSNLYISLAAIMGVPLRTFGQDSTGPLAGLSG